MHLKSSTHRSSKLPLTRETIGAWTEVEKICDGTRKMRAVLKFNFLPYGIIEVHANKGAAKMRQSHFQLRWNALNQDAMLSWQSVATTCKSGGASNAVPEHSARRQGDRI